MEQFHVGQLVCFGGGECVIERITRNWIKLVGHDIAVDPTALTPLEPRAGDRVRIVEVADYDGNPRLRVGDDVTLSAHDVSERFPHEWGSGEKNGPFLLISGGKAQSTYCRVILLSRASPPAEVKERKFYGTMPPASELPATLPIGTLFLWGGDGRRSSAVSQLQIAPSRSYYVGQMRHDHAQGMTSHPLAQWPANEIEWAQVEIQPAPTSAGEAVAAGWEPNVGDWVEGVGYGLGRMPGKLLRGEITEISVGALYAMIQGPDCRPVSLERSSLKPISPPPAGSALNGDAQAGASEPVGGGSLKPDRYAEHRRKNQANGVEWHGHPAASSRLESGIAASRKLAQTKETMDRPAVERHPSDWNSEDADELYSTI